MRRLPRSMLVALAVVAAPAAAAAEGDPAAADYEFAETTAKRAATPPPAAAPSRWYGLPIVVTDLAVVGLTVAGVKLSASFSSAANDVGAGMLIAAVGGYALGGPIVHLENGQGGKAAGSLALRLGLPAVGFGLVAALESGSTCRGDPSNCGIGNFFGALLLGAGGGAVVASVVDNAFLPYKAPPKADSPTLSIAPVLDPRGRFAGLGVSGVW